MAVPHGTAGGGQCARIDVNQNGSLIGIGEAMVELAPVEGGLFRRGFAGDTLNTTWYLGRLLGGTHGVGYCTRVGEDSISDEMVAFVAASGLDTRWISRDPERTVGLYMITLEGAERHFSYWRATSAARRLADRPGQLAIAFADAALVHFSGITLAVIEAQGRRNLIAALAAARAAGTRVSFDPNVRRRLWSDDRTLRDALMDAYSVADVVLPSFDDERTVWGDADPHSTVRRIVAHGVGEIVVKDGPRPAVVAHDNQIFEIPAPTVADVRDTTGAGDAFDAAHLAARLVGRSPVEACRFAHAVAGEVVRHPGALAPAAAMERFRTELAGAATTAR